MVKNGGYLLRVTLSFESNGVTVLRLKPDEKQAFRDATREVYRNWSERIGIELVKKAEAAIAKR